MAMKTVELMPVEARVPPPAVVSPTRRVMVWVRVWDCMVSCMLLLMCYIIPI